MGKGWSAGSQIDKETPVLIRGERENPRVRAHPHHGECSSRGFEVAQSSFAKYMSNDGAAKPGLAKLFDA